jgi:hypothetical protein
MTSLLPRGSDIPIFHWTDRENKHSRVTILDRSFRTSLKPTVDFGISHVNRANVGRSASVSAGWNGGVPTRIL